MAWLVVNKNGTVYDGDTQEVPPLSRFRTFSPSRLHL